MRTRHGDAAPRLALAGALLLPALMMLLVGGAPVAHATGAGAILHWDSRMIYAGQNNGFPEGPVGEHAQVHGANFTDADGTALTLQLVQGDVNNPNPPGNAEEFCKLTPTKVALPGNVSVHGGAFDASFDWPAQAGSGQWSICAYGPDGLPADGGTTDDGPFTALATTPPSLSLSAASVTAGGTITVTGHNFLPAQGNIQVVAGACHNCGSPAIVAQTASSSGAGGDFSVTMTVPASVAAGNYVVSAFNQPGTLDVGLQQPDGSKAFAVTAAPTPTPTPSPTATPTKAPSPSVAASPSTTPGQTGSSSGNGGLVVALVVVLGLLLLGIAALVVVLASRRPPLPPGGSGGYQEPTYTPPSDYDPARPSVYPGQGGGVSPIGPDDPTDPGLSTPRGR
jgi:hypothetical protein